MFCNALRERRDAPRVVLCLIFLLSREKRYKAQEQSASLARRISSRCLQIPRALGTRDLLVCLQTPTRSAEYLLFSRAREQKIFGAREQSENTSTRCRHTRHTRCYKGASARIGFSLVSKKCQITSQFMCVPHEKKFCYNCSCNLWLLVMVRRDTVSSGASCYFVLFCFILLCF